MKNLHRKLVCCPIGALTIVGCLAAVGHAQSDAGRAGQAGIHVGSFAFTPGIVFSSGYDTNVTHEVPELSDHETFAVPQIEGTLTLGSARVTGNGAFEVVSFNQHPHEGFANNREGIRLDLLNRLVRPYADYQRRNTFARPTGSEVPLRSRRIENELTTGVTLTGARTIIDLSLRELKIAYGADAILLGSSLAEKLNRHTQAETVGVKYRLTPLTAVGVLFGANQDRFKLSPLRNGDGVSVLGAVEFKSPAFIVGSFNAGYSRFQARRSEAAAFSGTAASGNLSYAHSGSVLSLHLDRNVSFSYDVALEYFVLTTIDVSFTQTVKRRWDVMGFGARNKLDYRPAQLAASVGRVDFETSYGTALGYRLTQSLRTGVTAERIRKVGGLPFDGTRATTFVTYGSAPFQRLDRPLPFQR